MHEGQRALGGAFVLRYPGAGLGLCPGGEPVLGECE